MMQLEKHIEVLLLTNDCVVVPGLGGFVAHHVNSFYDDRDHSFIPPTRTLGFNAQLVVNDSLLAQSYVDTYDISYPKAMTRIENDVTAVKKRLSETGEYEFHGLGKLEYNDEGHLQFEPCHSGILSPTLYGLGLLEFERISTPIFQLTNASQHLTTSSSERVVTIKVKTLRKIAVAAVAIFGFFLFANPFSNSNSESRHSEATFMSGLFKASSNQSATLTVGEKETTATSQQADDVQMTASEDYQLVLACKLPKANAQMIIDELSADGLHAELHEQNGDVKVLYGHYATRQAAYEAMNSLSGHRYFQSAWVLKSK